MAILIMALFEVVVVEMVTEKFVSVIRVQRLYFQPRPVVAMILLEIEYRLLLELFHTE